MKLQKDKIPKTAYVKIFWYKIVWFFISWLLMFVAPNFQVLWFYIDYKSRNFRLYFWFKEFLLMWCNCHGNLDKLGACDRYQCWFGIEDSINTLVGKGRILLVYYELRQYKPCTITHHVEIGAYGANICFIWMQLNFHKINSFFSSID